MDLYFLGKPGSRIGLRGLLFLTPEINLSMRWMAVGTPQAGTVPVTKWQTEDQLCTVCSQTEVAERITDQQLEKLAPL